MYFEVNRSSFLLAGVTFWESASCWKSGRMKDLFFVIPTEKSLSVISLGSSLLFAWILTIVFTFECPILYLQSIYKLSEEASITVAVTLGLTSLFMIVASICLKKFNLYLTWMICTVVTFLIQTAVIMWLVAVNGVTIFEWSLFPYTTRTVLAKLVLLLILVHLFVWAKIPMLWLCVYTLHRNRYPNLLKSKTLPSNFSQLSEEKKDAIVKERLANKLNLLFTPAPEDALKQDWIERIAVSRQMYFWSLFLLHFHHFQYRIV